MKKGTYWFRKLSEQEQKEFKENNSKQVNNFDTIMNEEFENFYLFILNCGFGWIFTPQGDEYWCKISNREVK